MTDKIQQNSSLYSSPYSDPLNERLDLIAQPILDDFKQFSDRFDTTTENRSFVNKTLSNIELFGGLGRIGNAIEYDEANNDTHLTTSRKEIAKYTTTQVSGLALGGLALLTLGVTLGPIGLAGGALGYFIGTKVGASAFDYLVDTLPGRLSNSINKNDF
jgi:hypothetical protein